MEKTLSTLNFIISLQSEISKEAAKGNLDASPPDEDAVSYRFDKPPVRLKTVDPVYPEKAQAARVEGKAEIRVMINKSGDVVDAEIIDGPLELVVSAVNAVRQWKFQPYNLRGQIIEVHAVVEVEFHLY